MNPEDVIAAQNAQQALAAQGQGVPPSPAGPSGAQPISTGTPAAAPQGLTPGAVDNAPKPSTAAQVGAAAAQGALNPTSGQGGIMGMAKSAADAGLKALITASDENKKTEIVSGAKPVRGFFETMRSATKPDKLGDAVVRHTPPENVTVREQREQDDAHADVMDRLNQRPRQAMEYLPGAHTQDVASDERVKQDVHSGGAQVGGFLDKLRAHEYEYKDPSAPGQAPGKHFSVMAQELEKAGPVGKSMVQDTPNGKMVDYSRGFATMLAGQADLHHRVKSLEQGMGKQSMTRRINSSGPAASMKRKLKLSPKKQ